MAYKRKKGDKFKLIQEDFLQDQNDIEIFPKRRKKPNYDRFELFQDHDFEGGQVDADMFYKEHKFVPYGFFVFYSNMEKNPNKEKVKNIFIRILKSDIYDKKFTENDKNKKREININFKPIELFSRSFRKKIGLDFEVDNDFRLEIYLKRLKGRKIYDYVHYIFNFYSSIFKLFKNIWNEYCLTEGKTSIDRESFCLWLYRLNSIIFDLFEFPYLKEDEYHWQLRYLFIRELIKDENSKKYECYYENNWNRMLRERLTKEMATDIRIMDAKVLLNEFFKQIKPISALDRFLISFYESFSNKLRKNNLLIKCAFCNEYIKYKKGKKYCSILIEGKDCGKKARNKRYYERRGKERLKIYRESTRELREFYREKGIKK